MVVVVVVVVVVVGEGRDGVIAFAFLFVGQEVCRESSPGGQM